MLKPKQVKQVIFERTSQDIPLRTVYQWMQDGKIAAKRLGASLLVDPKDLDIFLSDFPQAS